MLSDLISFLVLKTFRSFNLNGYDLTISPTIKLIMVFFALQTCYFSIAEQGYLMFAKKEFEIFGGNPPFGPLKNLEISELSQPQLNHNSIQPNITKVGFGMKMTTTTTTENSTSSIS